MKPLTVYGPRTSAMLTEVGRALRVGMSAAGHCIVACGKSARWLASKVHSLIFGRVWGKPT